ncbi:MAG: protein TolR [Candidatus Thioglobus sp.]|nr:MAG: protein TolR [Candidatus Thioglobus sp.]|tara:strand:- start:164 stop:604 length:441 start_codon:yes stop_codon:yes gene_type:complete
MSYQSMSRRRKPMSQINVVPYIDVMLVLLVIFMVTAPMFNQGVQVDLPQAPSEPIKEFMQQQEPLIVSVDALGKIYINKSASPNKALTGDEFRQAIIQVLANSEQKQAYVKGNHDLNYGSVVEVMVILQQAGVPSVGLITQPERDQ